MANITLTPLTGGNPQDKTVIPEMVVLSWEDATYKYTVAINQQTFSGSTPSSYTDKSVWQVSRLEVATGSLTYPEILGLVYTGFTSKVNALPSAPLQDIKDCVEQFKYWDPSDPPIGGFGLGFGEGFST